MMIKMLISNKHDQEQCYVNGNIPCSTCESRKQCYFYLSEQGINKDIRGGYYYGGIKDVVR